MGGRFLGSRLPIPCGPTSGLPGLSQPNSGWGPRQGESPRHREYPPGSWKDGVAFGDVQGPVSVCLWPFLQICSEITTAPFPKRNQEL